MAGNCQGAAHHAPPAEPEEQENAQNIIWVDPMQVRFSQGDINAKFRNGTYIWDCLTPVLKWKMSPKDLVDSFPLITVVYSERLDTYIVEHGHRRLYVMKLLKEAKLIENIKVMQGDTVTKKRCPPVKDGCVIEFRNIDACARLELRTLRKQLQHCSVCLNQMPNSERPWT